MFKSSFFIFVFLFVSASWAKFEFQDIAVGYEYACGHDGSKVSCWGSNYYNRIVQLDGFSNIKEIKLQLEFGCALDDYGLICWGKAPSLLPVMTSGGGSHFDIAEDNVCILVEGKLSCVDQDILLKMPPGLDHISSFKFYSIHANFDSAAGICAVQDGNPYCWSRFGEDLKIPTGMGKLNSIQMHWGNGCALDENNVLKCWKNIPPPYIGEVDLSVPADSGIVVDYEFNGSSGCLLNTKNEIKCWGSTVKPVLPPGFKAQRLAFGRGWSSGHTYCALNNLGELFCWGTEYGLMEKPLTITGYSSFKSIRNGICFEMGNKLNCTGIGFIPNITYSGLQTFEADDYSFCYQDNSGPHCVNNQYGSNIDIPPFIKSVKEFAILNTKTVCALLNEGKVQCWGANSDILANVPSNLKGVIKLSAGKHTVCALTDLNQVYCWGERPTTILNKKVKDVSAGLYHHCILFQNDEIQCTGLTENPPTYLFNIKGLVSGDDFSCAYTDSEVSCWGENTNNRNRGDNAISSPMKVVGTIKNISAGDNHACFEDDEEIKCWGSNFNGEYTFYQ